jgi:hypothetical protein
MYETSLSVEILVSKAHNFTHSQSGRVYDEEYRKMLGIPENREELMYLRSGEDGWQLLVSPWTGQWEVLDSPLENERTEKPKPTDHLIVVGPGNAPLLRTLDEIPSEILGKATRTRCRNTPFARSEEIPDVSPVPGHCAATVCSKVHLLLESIEEAFVGDRIQDCWPEIGWVRLVRSGAYRRRSCKIRCRECGWRGLG